MRRVAFALMRSKTSYAGARALSTGQPICWTGLLPIATEGDHDVM